jgi:hypothetical protein
LTNFFAFQNNARGTLASGYTVGGSQFILNPGQGSGFGSTFPINITAITNATYRSTAETLGIYQATGKSGDILTGVSGIENSTDRSYAIGDVIEMRWTAGEANLISSAISGLQNYSTGGPWHFLLGLGGNNLTIANDVADTYPVASFSGYFQRVDMSIKTAPTGLPVTVDILKSSNHGGSWLSLWNSTPANRPSIVATQNNASQTNFDTTTYAQGDWFRIDVASVGVGTAPGIGLFVKLS